MYDLKDTLDIITSFVTITGIPIGIYVYYSNKKKERKQKELEVYNSLDDKYIDFLKLCVEHTDLKISIDDRKRRMSTTD